MSLRVVTRVFSVVGRVKSSAEQAAVDYNSACFSSISRLEFSVK